MIVKLTNNTGKLSEKKPAGTRERKSGYREVGQSSKLAIFIYFYYNNYPAYIHTRTINTYAITTSVMNLQSKFCFRYFAGRVSEDSYAT